MSLNKYETLLSYNSNKFDTRKSLNRSNKKVPSSILETIESEGLTSEIIKGFKYPIYKYHGQITLHGDFSELIKTSSYLRIGMYKNIIINKNNTIGVKYTAIDYNKKRILASKLRYFNYSFCYNSQDEYYMKAFYPDNKTNLKEFYGNILNEYNSINVNSFYAIKTLLKNPLSGALYIVIYIKALYEKDIMPLFTAITGKNENDINLAIQAEKEEREKQEKERQIKEEQRKIELAAIKEKAAIDNQNDPEFIKFNSLPDYDRKSFEKGMHLITYSLNTSTGKYEYTHLLLNKGGCWFTVKKTYERDTMEFSEYNIDGYFKRSEKDKESIINAINKRFKNRIKIYKE